MTRTPARRFETGRPFFRVAAPVVLALTRLVADLEWSDQDKVPGSGGILIVANHVSNIDPLMLGDYVAYAGRWPTFLVKAEMFAHPWANRLFRGLGQIPVHRGSVKAVDSLWEADRALREGKAVIIYPEGTITYDPDHWPMSGHTGAARLAMAVGCPVIPIAQWGPNQLLPARVGARWIRTRPRKRVRIAAGDPIDFSDLIGTGDDRTAARVGTDRIMATLTAMVAGLRTEALPEKVFDQRKRIMVPREG